MTRKPSRSGFTLIELLIVVAIIGILAAIAVPNFLNAQVRAKLARVYSDLKALSTAIEMYKLDNNMYPGGDNWLGTKWWTKHTYRYHVLTTPISYIAAIPLDPFQHPIPTEIQQSQPIWDGGYVYDDVSRTGNTMVVYGRSFLYTCRIWGPAQDWSVAHTPFIGYYAATNGLRSLGVVAVLGPGGVLY